MMLNNRDENGLNKKVEDDGFTYPLILGIILIVFMIFIVIFEYMYFMTTCSQIDAAVERSVIGVATENWANVYQGVREGFAGGHTKEESLDAWTAVLSKNDIMKETQNMLELEYEGGKYVKKKDDGEILYTINPTTMEAIIKNVPISEDGVYSVGTGKGLIVEVSYDMDVSWATSITGTDATPIRTKRNVQVQYRPKF